MVKIETSSGTFETVTSVEKKTNKYDPKAIVVVIDEMSECMEGNYKLIDKIKTSIESIARLGRAAAVHLVLATQRPSGNVISNDLKNNVQQSVILGLFDTGASTLIFDDDVSHRSKPEIKGRGFTKTGKEIIEFQSYWTDPEKDFVFKETKNVDTTDLTEEVKMKTEELKLENESAEYLNIMDTAKLEDLIGDVDDENIKKINQELDEANKNKMLQEVEQKERDEAFIDALNDLRIKKESKKIYLNDINLDEINPSPTDIIE